jgi:hypothetical protein
LTCIQAYRNRLARHSCLLRNAEASGRLKMQRDRTHLPPIPRTVRTGRPLVSQSRSGTACANHPSTSHRNVGPRSFFVIPLRSCQRVAVRRILFGVGGGRDNGKQHRETWAKLCSQAVTESEGESAREGRLKRANNESRAH